MKLAEFYSINEAHRWTIEHESNGTGRLLSWEEDYSGTDDPDAEIGMSYEMLAHGNIEKLLAALPAGLAELDEEIRNAWEDAISTGDSIDISGEEGSYHVTMAPKQREDDSAYDSSEDELY